MRYILPHDTGMAPCVDNGLVSLATCKPAIRRTAKVGDWVLGFRPRPVPRGLLIWAARVGQVVRIEDYEPRFRGRSDAVYRSDGRDGFFRLRPCYHPGNEQFRRDISAPVPVFDKHASWYFGRNPEMLPGHLLHLAAAGIGHRVNGVNDTDATALEAWLAGNWPPGVLGSPPKPEFPSDPNGGTCIPSRPPSSACSRR